MGTSLLQLSAVQDAIDYALAQLAAWQQVPRRITIAQDAIQQLAGPARVAGDMETLAVLTADKEALDGIQAQYLDSSSLMGSVLAAARAAQAGGQPDAGQIADAGRLAGVIASGLTALAQVEQDLVSRGATLAVGPGGGMGAVPTWAKWSVIAVALWWFFTRVRR